MSIVDEIIAESGGEAPETIDVEANGRIWKVRPCRDASQVMRLERHIRKAQIICRRDGGKRVPPHWAPYLPVEDDVLRMIFYVSRLVVEPIISEEDAFRFAKQAGPQFLALATAVMGPVLGTAGEVEEAEIDDVKNG